MNALDALAARCGVESGFTDARGEFRAASHETRRALLAAMGLAARTEEEARTTLRELDRRDWERGMPPVVVCFPGESWSVEVNLPAGVDAVSWRIHLENGAELRGRAAASSLEVVARQPERDRPAIERRGLVLPADLPLGYHRLSVEPLVGETSLIVTPGKCWLPAPVRDGRRLWGVAAQLYLVRSARNWGVGDFGDLRRLVEMSKRRGADVVGLNPLHALFLDDPERASPYSPLSRLMLNVLNIDVEALPELKHCPEARALIESNAFQRSLMRCREARSVDYATVADLKLQALRIIFAAFCTDRLAARWREFEAFRTEAGEPLERGCRFLALRQHFAEQGASRADWRAWPDEYQDPASPAVAQFAARRATLVTFHAWLQFAADAQLAAVAEGSKPMAVGLYRDLAVGADPSGAEAWCGQRAVVRSASIGAPPDVYNPQGQDWGLPPVNPSTLRDEGYVSFIELVRANMRHAGGLRIDHVMALQQLFWIPAGDAAADGGYVRYPLRDLVGILALESQRHRCLVVGEDLGTVPAGFRDRMAAAGILSYRVMLFERGEAGYISPDAYPSLAVAVTGSHDLPTLRAWWSAADLDLKEHLGLFPTAEDRDVAWRERERDRHDLLLAFRRAGLDARADMDTDTLARFAHAFLARSEAAIALVQLDELTGESTPVNVPTTSTEYPNWRRRLSMTLDQLARHPRLAALAQILREERGAEPEPPSATRHHPLLRSAGQHRG